MGYYTAYNLNAFNTKEAAISGRLEEISEKSWEAARTLGTYDYFGLDRYENGYNERYGNSDPFYFVNGDEMKWYQAESDVRDLSLEYPDLWFRLEGDGEEKGDEWISIFHNGICSTIRIQYFWPEFDESFWEEE